MSQADQMKKRKVWPSEVALPSVMARIGVHKQTTAAEARLNAVLPEIWY